MIRIFYINWYSFFIAFILGIFYVYIITKDRKHIIFNDISKNVYIDEYNDCYKFDVINVNCFDNVDYPVPFI
jgi:hypothetical protein